jgi:hypothetical protein
MPAARRCSTTSTCPSTRTPRSACSARTARASRRCCGSWRASTRSSPARPGSPRAPRVGYLPQEPQLDPTARRCASNVMDRRRRQAGDPRPLQRPDRHELLGGDRRRDAAAAGRDRRQEPVGPRQPGRAGDGRLRCPPGDADVDNRCRAASAAASRSASSSWPARICCSSTSRPTISTPRRWQLAREAICASYPGAILIVTHDRYFLDNVTGLDPRARPRPRHPLRGQLLGLPRRRRPKRLAAGGPRGRRAPARDLEREQEWIAASPEGPPGQVQGAHPGLRRARHAQREAPRRSATAQIVIPPGPRLGDNVIEVDGLTKGYGDRLLIDDLSFKLPPGGIVGVIGPNGAGKTTLFRMITGQEKPDGGAIKIGESGPARLCRPVAATRSIPNKTVWEEISGGNDMITSASVR